MTILFISDLHLDSNQPDIAAIFLNFLSTQARECEALYILGDFFESWIGDDDNNAFHQKIISALKELNYAHIPVYLMVGNRDFLLGKQFAKETGCQLLTDPSIVDLYGVRTLIMHGDTLCVNDKNYLRFRSVVRNSFVQSLFLALPLFLRRKIASFLRKKSLGKKKPMEIMDADASAIKKVMQKHHVSLLIHGHTHRPTIENFVVDGKEHTRIVLSDWHQKGNVLVCEKNGEKRLEYFLIR